MKRNIAWNWRAAILVAGGVSLAVAATSIRAASDKAVVNVDSGVTQGPPAPPEGNHAETPPAIPALMPPPLEVTPGMEDIFRMARSGVSDEVLSAYVTKSGQTYHPTPDEIIYLKDLGVEPKTIAAIIDTGTGKTEPVREIAGSNFSPASSAPDSAGSEVSVDKKDGETTVNVTTHNHYAAAPQASGGSVAVSTPPPASDESVEEVNMEYFQGALSPYGSWVYVEGVGNCWRPTVAISNSNWRPYYDGGRWVYTDTGWYWLSDYSWGWAPFHYGRWTMTASYGWCWAPGYVWGPAWVAWRTTPTYSGWAPLPAYYYGGGVGVGYGYYGGGWGVSIGISWGSYNWVPNRYCYGYYPRQYAAPYAVKQEIYNNSTVIKPTIIGNNNTIIINGPNATTIANASNTEIRRINVRDVTNLRDPGPKDYIENGGQTLATFRPTMKPARAANSTGTVAPEARRGAVSPATSTDGTAALAGVESRRTSPATTGQSRTSRLPTQSASSTQSTVARQPGTTVGTVSMESVRNSNGSRTTASTTPRLAGQNTTIQSNPSYTTPAAQSTPILRDGRSIQYNVPVRHTSPVVAGGISTETRRSVTTYTYPGSTAVYSSRQTVRTPTVSRYSQPNTQGIQSISPTRQPSSSYSAPAQMETSRSIRPSSSYTAPTTSRMTIPASRPPTRSYTPSTQSYTPPSAPASRPSVSRPPTQIPASPSVSRPPASSPGRAPASQPGRSGSQAPGRR